VTDLGATTIPQAIQELFNITLSKHEKFRNAVNTFARKEKLFKLVSHDLGGGKDSRKRNTIRRTDFTTLHNAVLLQAIFPDPKTIEKIFSHREERLILTKWARKIIVDQQTIVGIGLVSKNLIAFFELLENDTDLTKIRLPNPFETLPQTQLDGRTSLCEAFLSQIAGLSQSDSMMAYFLNGDLENAAKCAKNLNSEQSIFAQYKEMILQKYEEAKEFEDLLEEWRN